MQAALRILVANRHPIERDGLRAIIELQEHWCVVGEACNSSEMLTLFRQQPPDVVIMGVERPCGNAIQATQCLLAEYPHARVILLSAFDERETIYQAIRAGAKSFLLKNVSTDELLVTITQVGAGHYALSPHVRDVLVQHLQQPRLTRREREILQSMAAGRSNKEIGAACFIAEGTVKAHLVSIMHKLQARDRTQAVLQALRQGLVPLT